MKALDLVKSEPTHRFNQTKMKVAADSEAFLIDGANRKKVGANIVYCQIPLIRIALKLGLVYLGLTGSNVFNIVYEVAASIDEQQPQTRFCLERQKNLLN